MKKFKCSSDIGSVLIGDEVARFALPNIGGDGTTVCEVWEREEWNAQLEACREAGGDYEKSNELQYKGCFEGRVNIFDHDCSDGDKEDVIYTLNGRYGYYSAPHKVIIVEWENYSHLPPKDEAERRKKSIAAALKILMEAVKEREAIIKSDIPDPLFADRITEIRKAIALINEAFGLNKIKEACQNG